VLFEYRSTCAAAGDAIDAARSPEPTIPTILVIQTSRLSNLVIERGSLLTEVLLPSIPIKETSTCARESWPPWSFPAGCSLTEASTASDPVKGDSPVGCRARLAPRVAPLAPVLESARSGRSTRGGLHGQLAPRPALRDPVEITKDQVMVGRDPTCDVILNDGSVSRKHARIERRGGGWASWTRPAPTARSWTARGSPTALSRAARSCASARRATRSRSRERSPRTSRHDRLGAGGHHDPAGGGAAAPTPPKVAAPLRHRRPRSRPRRRLLSAPGRGAAAAAPSPAAATFGPRPGGRARLSPRRRHHRPRPRRERGRCSGSSRAAAVASPWW